MRSKDLTASAHSSELPRVTTNSSCACMTARFRLCNYAIGLGSSQRSRNARVRNPGPAAQDLHLKDPPRFPKGNFKQTWPRTCKWGPAQISELASHTGQLHRPPCLPALTPIYYSSFHFLFPSSHEPLGLCWNYIGIVQNNMETTIFWVI